MKAPLLALLLALALPHAARAADCEATKALLQEGDLIFLEIDHLPFSQVAETTNSWTSHVGVAFQESGKWVVYESGIPRSRVSDLCEYLTHSTHGRVAVTRRHEGLAPAQVEQMRAKAKAMLGVIYHTGFDLDDWRQFCSKYAYLVYQAAGIEIGKIITFRQLLDGVPEGPRKGELVTFWTRWFVAGFRWSGIPWERRTITPASELEDTSFDVILGKREI